MFSNKILIVDDDDEFRHEFRELLDGYAIEEAADGKQALGILERANTIGLVILDEMMPGIRGTDLLRQIKANNPQLKIIMLTGHSSKDVAIEAIKGHADDFIEKPLDPQKIKEIVRGVLAAGEDESDNDAATLEGKIEKVKRFTEINSCKKISLEDVAGIACLSPKYLSRVFKQAEGKSFSEFRLRLKIDKSKELLEKSRNNINQISDRLGYENVESFIRQFKKFTGLTPTAFRKKASWKRLPRRRPAS